MILQQPEHGLVPLVVGCRLADYQRLGVRLRLRGAVQLQPLTDQQVDSCLAKAGIASAVRTALGDEGRGLIDSPLMLSMTVRAFRAQQSAPLPTTGPPSERRSRLFDAYIDAMLARRRDGPPPGEPAVTPRYPRDETLAWLGWLARSMRAHRRTQFRLDRLQPTWLATPRQRGTMSDSVCCASLFGSGVIAGLLGCAIGGLLFGFSGTEVNGLLIGLGVWGVSLFVVPWAFIVRVIAGPFRAGPFTQDRFRTLMTEQFTEIRPVEALSWSWPVLRAALFLVRRLAVSLVVGVLSGLLLGLYTWISGGLLTEGLEVGLIGALIIGTVVSLSQMLTAGASKRLAPTSRTPNEGIRRSARHAFVGFLAGGLAPWLVFGLILGLIYGPTAGLAGGLIGGLTVAQLIAPVKRGQMGEPAVRVTDDATTGAYPGARWRHSPSLRAVVALTTTCGSPTARRAPRTEDSFCT